MTPLAQSNVANLVTEINAQNTHALSVFLPVYDQWKLNADRLRTSTPPIDPGKPPVGPAIGTVNVELAWEIFDAYEAGVQSRRNQQLDKDGKNVPVYEPGHDEPDYSPAIRYKLYVPATDAVNPAINTDPMPPGPQETEDIFQVQAGDHAPAGVITRDASGRKYVKRMKHNGVGASYWYEPIAA